nr:23S rRNA (pseudouridine(1915)-N(3))-methyltransferase RlmH [uncultured Brevibacillus sp.]
MKQLGVSGKSTVSHIVGVDSITPDEVSIHYSIEMDLGLKTTIIFEQIYRAYVILNNETYHKKGDHNWPPYCLLM